MKTIKKHLFSTRDLLEKLLNAENMKMFFKRYEIPKERVSFHEYINSICAEKGLEIYQVIEEAGIDPEYGRQIYRGIRKPSRDKTIQLAIGMRMGYDETQKLLRAARKDELYPYVQRDAAVIFAINNALNYRKTQEKLKELSLPVLGQDKKL